MRIHCLQHQHFEGMANIGRWAEEKNYEISHTLFYGEGILPKHSDYDCLLIMGGSMGAYDEDKFPWLKQEKKFIDSAIEQGKTVMGICLGSQLIAEVLGGHVSKGHSSEVGWLPVHTAPEARQTSLFKMFPETFTPLHWHNDCFELPRSATRLAFSAAYPNQAFQYGDRVIGIQFHLELSFEDVRKFLRYQRYNKKSGNYEQTKEQILACKDNFVPNYILLHQVLDALDVKVAHNHQHPTFCELTFSAEERMDVESRHE